MPEDIVAAVDLIESMRQKLAERDKQVMLLRDALDSASQIITFEGVPYYLLGLEERDEALAAKQAEVDALMLEYCPNEMTPEQLDNWAAHQRPAKEK